MLNTFESTEIETGAASVFVRWGGVGPPILLLHGFPETHLMWRKVAPVLAKQFTVVCADLPGYGSSGIPSCGPDHASFSKRAMAKDMVEAMEKLGFSRFAVAGHDRGGRVAYRLALDHPERIERLAVLDVIPVADVWERADANLVIAFWPWSLLAQPEPLPERLVSAAPDAVIDDAFRGWGSPEEAFEPEIREAYIQALSDPARIHAICEEYRAAATIDRRHDEMDRQNDHRIICPVLMLWSDKGPLGHWYADTGGPLGVWREWANDVRGHPLKGGHFFPEELPEETAAALGDFFMQTT